MTPTQSARAAFLLAAVAFLPSPAPAADAPAPPGAGAKEPAAPAKGAALPEGAIRKIPIADRINALAFSPDGSTLASGSQRGNLLLWNVADGKKLRTLDAARGWIRAVAFSPDGKTLASAGEGGLRLWTLAETGKSRLLLGHKGPVVTVSFSGDGKLLASGGHDGTARIWDVATGKTVGEPIAGSGEFGVWSVALSPDGKRLILSPEEGKTRLINLETRKDIRELEPKRQKGMAHVGFSRDGRHAMASSGRITVWDSATGEQAFGTCSVGGMTTSAVFCPDGKTIAVPSSYEPAGAQSVGLFLVDLPFCQVRRVSPEPMDIIALSPDGRMFATSGQEEGGILLWDAARLGKNAPRPVARKFDLRKRRAWVKDLSGDSAKGIPEAVLEAFRRGDAFLEKGWGVDALSAYYEAEDLWSEKRFGPDRGKDPAQTDRWDRVYRRILMFRGEAQFQDADFKRALSELSRADLWMRPGAVKDPKDPEEAFLHLRLGQCQLELGEKDKAAESLRRALAAGGEKVFEGEDPKYLTLAREAPKP